MESDKVLVEPILPFKGVKAQKGSVKMAADPGLQYVEVAVDKPPSSPPQAFIAGNKLNNKTNYAEVRLPSSNGLVEEVNESDEAPQLPDKENKTASTANEMEDIWVRNTSTPPPSLPPKIRELAKGAAPIAACDSIEPGAKSGRPPASLPHPAGQSRAEGLHHASGTGLDTGQPARRVATPELSRKGYEDMSLTPASGGRATPPSEDIWKLQPHDIREHPPKQGLAYENVQLTHRAKPPCDMQSMLICDVDQPVGVGVGADGYVVVNGPSSQTTNSKGYENVASNAPKPVGPEYANISNKVAYLAMTGGMSADSTSTRTSKQAPDDDNEDSDNGKDNILREDDPIRVYFDVSLFRFVIV